jgi:hypothetical protein
MFGIGLANRHEHCVVCRPAGQKPDFDHPNNHKNSSFAVQVLKQTAANTRMIMAGENEFILSAFTNYIRENGLDERIALLGVRRDMNHLMLALTY